MLRVARQRAEVMGVRNRHCRAGRAEAIPVDDGKCDVGLASLSLMYALAREAAARESARVLRPDGRLVAAVWAGPDQWDLVRCQHTAGRCAPTPPVPGVGPGALAAPSPFLSQRAAVGIPAQGATETLGFDCASFASAWEVMAHVTTSQLAPAQQQEAQAAGLAALWPHGDGPRHCRNVTQCLLGQRQHEE
jgi:SAM-dependent methyltransferase